MTKYQEYQLQWMIDHNVSLKDFMNEILFSYTTEDECLDDFFETECKERFNAVVCKNGIKGQMFVGEEEWKDNEGSELPKLSKYQKKIYDVHEFNPHEYNCPFCLKTSMVDYRLFDEELAKDGIYSSKITCPYCGAITLKRI